MAMVLLKEGCLSMPIDRVPNQALDDGIEGVPGEPVPGVGLVVRCIGRHCYCRTPAVMNLFSRSWQSLSTTMPKRHSREG